MRLVVEERREVSGWPGIVRGVGCVCGVHGGALWYWVRKRVVQAVSRAVAAGEEFEWIRQLEREYAELRRAIEVLGVAAVFVVGELDFRLRR